MTNHFEAILDEITKVFRHSNFNNVQNAIDSILKAETIIVFGAGRVGLVMKAFAKRLRHLGLNCFYLDDTTVPKTGEKDLLILGTGSGSTPSVRCIAEVALDRGLNICTFTATADSEISKISNDVIVLDAPTKLTTESSVISKQPMTTLFEQSLYILLDSIVLEMMRITGESSESMKNRHNVIE